MRILIVWDDSEQGELLGLYLGTGENETDVVMDPALLTPDKLQAGWDAVVLSATFPKTVDEGFIAFTLIQQNCPGIPVVLACRMKEMLDLPRFLNHGLRYYLVRDDGGDFVFLTLSCVDAAVESCKAQEAGKLAERLREEMDGVRRLQESIIPQGFQPPPGYKMAARYEPAQMTAVGHKPVVMAGGDYYDILRPDNRTLIALIGDASGHGLKACMSIMTMHTLVRMFQGAQFRDTGSFVAEINKRLCENSIVQQGGGFITLFYGAIDTETHMMTWTSAGHPPAMLHRRDTNEVIPIGTDADCGLPLGIYSDAEYTSYTVQLPPESRVVIYSDGLPDALPPSKDGSECFGMAGIMGTMRANTDAPLEQALDQLFIVSNAFTRGVGRHDDTSVVLVERDGPDSKPGEAGMNGSATSP